MDLTTGCNGSSAEIIATTMRPTQFGQKRTITRRDVYAEPVHVDAKHANDIAPKISHDKCRPRLASSAIRAVIANVMPITVSNSVLPRFPNRI